MSAISLLLYVTVMGNSPKGFSSSPDGGPILNLFSPFFVGEEGRKSLRLRANGLKTDIVFPRSLNVYTAGYDSNGRPVGGLTGSISGARLVGLDYGVMYTGKAYKVVYPLPKYRSTRFVGINKAGKILGVAYNDTIPNMDAPSDDSHGFLLHNGKAIDLGPAVDVSFRKDGIVQGYYHGDKDGRPYNVVLVGSTLRHKFTWNNGVRKPDGQSKVP